MASVSSYLKLHKSLRQISCGNSDALKEFYLFTCDTAYALSVEMLRDPKTAENALKECYQNLWEHPYCPKGMHPFHWFLCIVRRHCVSKGATGSPIPALHFSGGMTPREISKLTGYSLSRVQHEILSCKSNAFTPVQIPDLYDSILMSTMFSDQCSPEKKEKISKRFPKGPFAAILVVFLLFLGIFALSLCIPRRVSYILYLDGTASISLSMDTTDRVVAAESHNNQGAQVLQDIYIYNSKKEKALEAVLDAMIDNAFLNPNTPDTLFFGIEDVKNGSGLYSSNVSMAHTENHAYLLELLDARNCTATLFSYHFSWSSFLQRFSEKYGTNLGMAAVIRQDNLKYGVNDDPSVKDVTTLYLHWITRFNTKTFLNANSETQRMAAHLAPEEITPRVIEYLKLPIRERDVEPLELSAYEENGESHYLLSVKIDNHIYQIHMHAETGEITECTRDGLPCQP